MTRIASLLALSLVTLNTGCFLFDAGEKTEFVEADDVRLDLPQSIAMRDGGAQIRGDLHVAVQYTADQANTWVTRLVENAATVVRVLDDVRPTERDGNTRIYGPYDDDDGRDLSWLVRLDTLEDGSKYEVFVGTRGAASQADMDLMMTGELHHDERERSGGFVMDFDVVEKHPEIKGPDADLSVIGGVVEVTFTRNVDTEEKTIDLDFKAVSFEYLGYLDDDSFYSDDRYGYEHHADGSGSFVLAAYGEWDDHGWSGPEKERMLAQAVWNADGAGRTHGEVLEVDGVGDMKHGDLFLDECFGADGFLTWRALNEPYALEAPGYNFGEEKSCALPTTALENP